MLIIILSLKPIRLSKVVSSQVKGSLNVCVYSFDVQTMINLFTNRNESHV